MDVYCPLSVQRNLWHQSRTLFAVKHKVSLDPFVRGYGGKEGIAEKSRRRKVC